MRLLINIPKEFEQHFQADRFEDSLRRLNADIHLLAGLYERETALMLIEAFKNAIPVPPHGRLIDESAIDLSKYEKAAYDALHNGKGSILYDCGVLAGARAITRLVRNAPTIIEAEEGE